MWSAAAKAAAQRFCGNAHASGSKTPFRPIFRRAAREGKLHLARNIAVAAVQMNDHIGRNWSGRGESNARP
jgi:hypothetical protein